jgi:hypothetical protein
METLYVLSATTGNPGWESALPTFRLQLAFLL